MSFFQKFKRAVRAFQTDPPEGKNYPIYLSRDEILDLDDILAGNKPPPTTSGPARDLMWRVRRLSRDVLPPLEKLKPRDELAQYTATFSEVSDYSFEVTAASYEDAAMAANQLLATNPSKAKVHRVVRDRRISLITGPLRK